ncbi:nucleotidyltransferase family protein [Geodermatophilus sp. SYSU D00766]
MTKDPRTPQPSQARAGPCTGAAPASATPTRVCAPHGLEDLLDLVVRPDPAGPAARDVHEAKAARWQAVWPELTVLSWEHGRPSPRCSVPWQT